MLIQKILTPQRIIIPLTSTDKSGVIAELVALLHKLDPFDTEENIRLAIEARENKMSTGIGYEVAVPHAKMESVPEIKAVCGLHPDGIDFNSPTGDKVKLVFLMVSPKSTTGPHLKVLSGLSKLIVRDSIRNGLLGAKNPEAFLKYINNSSTEN
jgi:fructose PTS system EIIBC or EIIC component